MSIEGGKRGDTERSPEYPKMSQGGKAYLGQSGMAPREAIPFISKYDAEGQTWPLQNPERQVGEKARDACIVFLIFGLMSYYWQPLRV